jgi:hypothetical protein
MVYLCLRSLYVRLRLPASTADWLRIRLLKPVKKPNTYFLVEHTFANITARLGGLGCCSNLRSRIALRAIATAQFQPFAWTFFVIRRPWLSTQRPTSLSAGLLTASLHRHLPALALCSLTVTGINGILAVVVQLLIQM